MNKNNTFTPEFLARVGMTEDEAQATLTDCLRCTGCTGCTGVYGSR